MPTPLPQILAPLTIPASWMYRGVMTLRNRHYERGEAQRVNVPVISVGNITTGGVGKTPMVMLIARRLLEAGMRPAICMRGYGAPRDSISDEHAEYAQSFPDVPIIANPDRVSALRAHLDEDHATDCVLLDDGFQHRRLHRDLDLVLIDATQETFSQRLLPAGHLRESPSGLRRAHGVIVTHSNSTDEMLTALIHRYHGAPPLAWARHIWTALRVLHASGESCHDPSWLRDKRVATLLGIGNPTPIHHQLTNYGATIACDIPVRDHERYDKAKLHAIRHRLDHLKILDAMVVTQKDWVKLQDLLDLQHWPVAIVVPELAISVFEGQAALDRLVLCAAHGQGPTTQSPDSTSCFSIA